MQDTVQSEISLKELLLILWNGKRAIAIITALFLLLGTLGSLWFHSKNSNVSIVVAFKHDGIAQHLNPDGTQFDPYQIASPYILNEVLRLMQLEGVISPNVIRKNLEMKPIIPDDQKAKVEFFLEREGETVDYYPDEYILTVHVDTGAGLTADMTQSIVNHIVTLYRNYFTEKYVFKERLVDLISFSDDVDYDYVDLSQVYKQQLDALIAYNSLNAVRAPEFRSKQTGLTFNDLLESIEVIQNVDFLHWSSLVSEFKISKSPTELKNYYSYQINFLNEDLSLLKAQNAVNLKTLASLEDSENSLVQASLEQSQEQASYFQSLVMSTMEIAESINKTEKNIAQYQKELQDLVEGEQGKTDFSLMTKKADVKADELNQDIAQLIEISNLTAEEYYNLNLTSSFFALSPTAISNSVRLPLNVAISGVLGLMLSVFFVFFRAYMKTEAIGGKSE